MLEEEMTRLAAERRGPTEGPGKSSRRARGGGREGGAAGGGVAMAVGTDGTVGVATL